MKFVQLDSVVSVAGQLYPADIAGVKEQGFKIIVCNRPDDEEANQPESREIAAAAKDAGLEFLYLPITPGTIDEHTTIAFKGVLASEVPVFAYCRTGHRSSILWALSRMSVLPVGIIVEAVKKAGFDFKPPSAQA